MDFFKKQKASIKYLDNVLVEEASFSRVTHLGVGAHQDDLEIMAAHGILNCYQNADQWFAGVVCTDGSGSARDGEYKDYSDQQMQEVRQKEQLQASEFGQYSFIAQLGYTSSEVKCVESKHLREDIKNLIAKSKPSVIYTHNIFDKHDTHVAVVVNVIEALRELPADMHPKKFYGCEVWRALDWLPESYKVGLDVSGGEDLIAKLISYHRSQVVGGKRYDLATLGRMKSNATYAESHSVDEAQSMWFAVDLSPLLSDVHLDINEYAKTILNSFVEDVSDKITRFIGV